MVVAEQVRKTIAAKVLKSAKTGQSYGNDMLSIGAALKRWKLFLNRQTQHGASPITVVVAGSRPQKTCNTNVRVRSKAWSAKRVAPRA